MKISAISNINFKNNNTTENTAVKDDKKGLSSTTKALIGVGAVAAGTLAVYFITRNSKAAKEAAEHIKPKTNEVPKPKVNDTSITEPVKPVKADVEVQANTSTNKLIENIESEVSFGPNSFELSSQESKEAFSKLDEKLKTVLSSFTSDFDDLTHRSVEQLSNGKTKVTYLGATEDRDIFKEIFVFGKDNDLLYRQSESMVLEKVLDKFPIEYRKSTKFSFPDKKTKSSETSFYLDMKPKRKVTSSGEDTKTVVYGYDFNAKPSGLAYTEDGKVILKLYDKKFGQVFESFDDLFKNIERDQFKMR